MAMTDFLLIKEKSMRQAFAGLFILLFGGTVLAQTTVPHTFTAGAAARASEVNANFAALATAINDVAARVSALENPSVSAASVPGTYKLLELEVGVNATSGTNSGTLQVTAANVSGTVVFSAGGTATFTISPSSTSGRITVTQGNTTAALERDTSPETNATTWTISGGEVVVTDNVGAVTRFVPATPRLLIGTGREQDGSNDLYWLSILVRQ